MARRAELIGEIGAILKLAELPEDMREAGLTIIGWLARRHCDEPIDTTLTVRHG